MTAWVEKTVSKFENRFSLDIIPEPTVIAWEIKPIVSSTFALLIFDPYNIPLKIPAYHIEEDWLVKYPLMELLTVSL